VSNGSLSAQKALCCLATHSTVAPATFSEQQALEILFSHGLREQDLDLLLDAGLLDAIGNSCYQIHPVIAAYARLGIVKYGCQVGRFAA
jgi:hypothetical protein